MELQPELASLYELLEIERITPIDGGHMCYDKVLIQTKAGDNFFVKSHDPTLLTDDIQAEKMWQYLIKEQYVYDILNRHGYQHTPNAQLHDNSLILDAHITEEGWLWDAPTAEKHQSHYINDVLTALGGLQNVAASKELHTVDPERSLETLLRLGWSTINPQTAPKIAEKIDNSKPDLHAHVFDGIEATKSMLSTGVPEIFTEKLSGYTQQNFDSIAHFDARQSNIAWHPQQGVSIVDWSWASAGPIYGDTTMFLIDLHKSNIDISSYVNDHFDRDHALLLIGYWLARSITSTPNDDSTVRFHQIASAISAADLITTY